MRSKIILTFVLLVFVPTALLAYFGLMAVKSEKAMVESNLLKRYESIADVVEEEIMSALKELPQSLIQDKVVLETVLIKQTSIFADETAIFDTDGNLISGIHKVPRGKVALNRRIKNLPYTVAVYERYPQFMERLEAKKKWFSFYVAIIGWSTIAVIGAGLFASWAIYRQWRMAELKSEFVSHLSHALKGPLTSVRMFSEMLKAGSVPSEEKKHEYYDIIAAESERLTNLANNILDFSRIEEGRKKYKFKEEDISKMITETVERFKSYMCEAGRPVTLDIENGLSRVRIDASGISQALMNLLSNAAKYSPPESEIKISLGREKGGLRIEVSDKGMGISAEEQKKIFRKFYRIPSSETEVEGTGLGLLLVKYIAEVHGGHVRVESEVGRGSKFTLVLPVVQANRAA